MNNIYQKLTNNVLLFNKLLGKLNKQELYVTINPTIDDFIYNESSKDKKYKNLISDTFFDKTNFLKRCLLKDIFYTNNNIIIYLYNFDFGTQYILSSDNLNTFIDIGISNNINNIEGSIRPKEADNTFYLYDKSHNILSTTNFIDFKKLLPENNSYIVKFWHTSNNSYVVTKKDNDNIYYINDGKENIVSFKNFLGNSNPGFGSTTSYYNFFEFTELNSIVYCYDNRYNGRIYYSTDKINFDLLVFIENSTGSSISNQIYFGKHFLNNGCNLSVVRDSTFEFSLYKTYESFSDIHYYSIKPNDLKINYKKILTFQSLSTESDLNTFIKIIDDVIYILSAKGVYFSKNFGSDWEIIPIQDPIQITKCNNKLLVLSALPYDGTYKFNVSII